MLKKFIHQESQVHDYQANQYNEQEIQDLVREIKNLSPDETYQQLESIWKFYRSNPQLIHRLFYQILYWQQEVVDHKNLKPLFKLIINQLNDNYWERAFFLLQKNFVNNYFKLSFKIIEMEKFFELSDKKLNQYIHSHFNHTSFSEKYISDTDLLKTKIKNLPEDYEAVAMGVYGLRYSTLIKSIKYSTFLNYNNRTNEVTSDLIKHLYRWRKKIMQDMPYQWKFGFPIPKYISQQLSIKIMETEPEISFYLDSDRKWKEINICIQEVIRPFKKKEFFHKFPLNLKSFNRIQLESYFPFLTSYLRYQAYLSNPSERLYNTIFSYLNKSDQFDHITKDIKNLNHFEIFSILQILYIDQKDKFLKEDPNPNLLISEKLYKLFKQILMINQTKSNFLLNSLIDQILQNNMIPELKTKFTWLKKDFG